MTADLVEFLRARLGEDERISRAAGGRSERAWRADMSGKDSLGMPSWPLVVRRVDRGRLLGAVAHLPIMEERSEDRMEHIARYDPARVLAEVDAKRRIIDECDAAPNHDNWGMSSMAESILRKLALPYADHPDYRLEWAPDAQ